MKMVDIIKKASSDMIESGKPVAILYGNVTNGSPLEVNVDQRFTLSEDFLIVLESMTELKITVGVTEYTIRKQLEAGDKVILLRTQGGENYIILDRVI